MCPTQFILCVYNLTGLSSTVYRLLSSITELHSLVCVYVHHIYIRSWSTTARINLVGYHQQQQQTRRPDTTERASRVHHSSLARFRPVAAQKPHTRNPKTHPHITHVASHISAHSLARSQSTNNRRRPPTAAAPERHLDNIIYIRAHINSPNTPTHTFGSARAILAFSDTHSRRVGFFPRVFASHGFRSLRVWCNIVRRVRCGVFGLVSDRPPVPLSRAEPARASSSRGRTDGRPSSSSQPPANRQPARQRHAAAASPAAAAGPADRRWRRVRHGSVPAGRPGTGRRWRGDGRRTAAAAPQLCGDLRADEAEV